MEAAKELIEKQQAIVMKKRQKVPSVFVFFSYVTYDDAEQEAMKAAQDYAAANPGVQVADTTAAAVDEAPAPAVDDNAMDVDNGAGDKRKRKAESPVVRRANPEPTQKKVKPGKSTVCFIE